MQKLNQSRAAQLGALAGTAVRGLLWINDQIDWAEVAQIVIHGLKVLVVLTLLAGRATRRGWDGLLLASEHLGELYAAWIAPTAPRPPLQRLRLLRALAAALRAAIEAWRLRQRLSLEAYLALA